MKRNDIKALHDKNLDELNKQLAQLQMDVAKLRLEKAVGKLENPSSLKHFKYDIARIKTVIKERELKQNQPMTVQDLVGKA